MSISILRSVSLVAAVSHVGYGLSIDNVKQTAATVAHDLTLLYTNNATNTSSADVGTLGRPYYWWEAAAVWGGLIDYYTYTNDSSYNSVVSQALLAQTGPNNDYLPPWQIKDCGNDDQVFWALACMDAVEYGFPNPTNGQPQWLDLATNVWNEQMLRWDNSSCNGGLKWQIFSYNAGYDYKNVASNAGFFQLSARLARYTANGTYSQWANTAWDWMSSTGLITSDGNVYDGTDDTTGCQQVDHVAWSYNSGSLLYGASVLYNNTNGSSLWQSRITSLLNATITIFTQNNSNILLESACEPTNICDTDQIAFKGILARWLAKSTVMAPITYNQASRLLTASAAAAAHSCSGGSTGTACGLKWDTGSYDSSTGVGQELNALSVIQALLLLDGDVQAVALEPLRRGDRPLNGTTTSGTANSTSSTTTSSTTTRATSSATVSLAVYTGAGVPMATSRLWSILLTLAFVAVAQV